MPKYGIHHIVLKKLRERLDASDDPEERELARILEDNPFAASLGSVGPDLLFWAPDYAIVENLRELVEVYDHLLQKWDDLNEFAETIQKQIDNGREAVLSELKKIPWVGPVVAKIEGDVEAIDAITEKFAALGDGFQDEFIQALLVRLGGLDAAVGSDGNTLARSVFQGLFQSMQQGGREEMEWYWFEMLHYRRTGAFVRALIKNAEASGHEEQMAYAYGYATHYATDVVGHPFVNTISGSPYRINVQRHVVIENFMDQWKWSDEFGTSIRNTLFGKTRFDVVEELPDGLANLIAKTLEEVYRPVVHPLRYVTDTTLAESVGINPERDGFLRPQDIKTAYTFQKLMIRYLGGQEKRLKPKEPFPGAATYASNLVSSGTAGIPPPPTPPSSGLPRDINDFFEKIDMWFAAVAEYVAWATEAEKAIADAIGSALKDVSADPPDNLLMLIQALAYLLQCLLYDLYRELHMVLALAGLAYPEPDDTRLGSPLADSLITLRRLRYKEFPLLRTPGQPHLDTRSYQDFMTHRDDETFSYQRFESPRTIASHYLEEGRLTPDGFIEEAPFDEDLLTRYARAKTPKETRDLASKTTKSFGNAVDLSKFILAGRNDASKRDVVFCDWNLDGDRGYGYKTWDGVPFTVAKGEIDGAIDGNEPIATVVDQDFSVWTKVTERADDPDAPHAVFTPEIYVAQKTAEQTLISALDISEQYIPAMLKKPEEMAGVPIDRWVATVPVRFRLRTASIFQNFFFCNGLTTTPSSGARAAISLQMALNRAIASISGDRFRVRLIHNYTTPELGDLAALGDLVEAVLGDYLGAILNTKALANGDPLGEVTNPTQVAVLALLHHGMEEDHPLLLSGHSQGCMITANAVLVFSSLGARHSDYLKKRVKLFHLEPELIVDTRVALRRLVKEYLVYIMNARDPAGTDLLTLATAGQFPLIPNQTDGLILEGDGVAAIRDLTSNPDPLSIDFYESLATAVQAGGDDVSALVGYLLDANMTAHYIPVQLEVIAHDIADNRFRTDPGSLSDATIQLSTAAALNGSSVNVRDFLTTA